MPGECPEGAAELVQGCLRLDPRERPTAEEAAGAIGDLCARAARAPSASDSEPATPHFRPPANPDPNPNHSAGDSGSAPQQPRSPALAEPLGSGPRRGAPEEAAGLSPADLAMRAQSGPVAAGGAPAAVQTGGESGLRRATE